MSLLLFGDNFSTTLAASINAAALSAQLLSVSGLPVISGDQYYILSFFDAATQTITEIVHVTARSGSVLTIVRAQEGTTALDWAAGSVVNWNWTAGQAAMMVQQFELQAQAGNYAEATGGANTYVAVFDPVLSSNIEGAPLRVKWSATNTAASTINVGAGATALTASDGSPLEAGDVVDGEISTIIFDGTSYVVDTARATDTRVGVTRLATDVEAEAGTDDTVALTPANLAALASANFADPGHAILPGGLIVQWGQASVADDSAVVVTFDIPFPNAALMIIASVYRSSPPGGTHSYGVSASISSASQGVLTYGDPNGTPTTPVQVGYIVIGH